LSTTLPTTITIKEIIPEAEGIKTFVFDSDLKFNPGQFVMLWIPGVDEKPFGAWRSPAKQSKDGRTKDDELRITVSAVGDFSRKKHELKVGDNVGIRGPFGKGFTVPKQKKIVLVGGGFGTAPLLGLARQAQDCDLTFIIGARSEDLLFGENYAEELGAKVLISTNDGSAGEKGFSTDLLEKLLKDESVDKVFSCGPELMMKRVAEICQEKNVDCELSLERYMKCGIGVCGSCAMDDSGWCACSDGPVIDGAQALKSVEFGKYHRDSVGIRDNF
jgi:dihydroorotate dehydrogenase electron transfer subunit